MMPEIVFPLLDFDQLFMNILSEIDSRGHTHTHTHTHTHARARVQVGNEVVIWGYE